MNSVLSISFKHQLSRYLLTSNYRPTISTIANTDKVVVMDQGQIVEQGIYQQSLAQRGKLRNYHQMQNNLIIAASGVSNNS